MSNPTLRDIIEAVDAQAAPRWQEDFDNSGWQILLPHAYDDECSAMMICVDATEEIIREAATKGCNLLLTHHPLLFRGVKRIDDSNRTGRCIIEAIKQGVSIYSCHTPVDLAPEGVSHALAHRLGLVDVEVLSPKEPALGLGVVGDLPVALPFNTLVQKVKQVCGSPVARCSGVETVHGDVKRVAIGGGACSDLIPTAIASGAQVMITSDVKHNLFLDYAHAIAVVDLGHYETEDCTKDIFYNIITKKFPNFVPYYSNNEKNPIIYL